MNTSAQDSAVKAYPRYAADIYSDTGILEPYSHYRNLRDLGGAVWLDAQSVWAISRYQDVVAALRKDDVFSSGSGIAFTDVVNQALSGTTLGSDRPLHDKLRKIIMKQLTPGALVAMTAEIEGAAEELVERLVTFGAFDAVTDLAQYLPLTIVAREIGLPEEGREQLLDFAAASFNLIGPSNERWQQAFPIVTKFGSYAGALTKDQVKPGGWADHLLNQVNDGVITTTQYTQMIFDYTGPSLDTTIFATANMIELFAKFPDQWDILRERPELAGNAINEAIRLESPVRGFTRLLTQDYEIDGVTMPAGSRALILYGSANRDERKWENPEAFDITRKLGDHVGFGFGIHSCAGMHLARLEIASLLKALIPRVSRFIVNGPVERVLNNSLRGHESLPVRVET